MNNSISLENRIIELKQKLKNRISDLKAYELEMNEIKNSKDKKDRIVFLIDLIYKTKCEIDYISNEIFELENGNEGGISMGKIEKRIIEFHWEAESSYMMVPKFVPVINVNRENFDTECYTMIEATNFEASGKKGFVKFTANNEVIEDFFIELENTNWDCDYLISSDAKQGKWKITLTFEDGNKKIVDGFSECVPSNSEEICIKLDRIIKINPDCRFSGNIF